MHIYIYIMHIYIYASHKSVNIVEALFVCMISEVFAEGRQFLWGPVAMLDDTENPTWWNDETGICFPWLKHKKLVPYGDLGLTIDLP